MKKKNKKTMKTASLKISKIAVFCLIIASFGIIGGIITPKVLAAVWQDPTEAPAEVTGLEPPLNTSSISQEKKGSLRVATQDGTLSVGTTTVGNGDIKFFVQGDSIFDDNVNISGNLGVPGTANISDITADSAIIVNDLSAGSDFFRVDDSSGKYRVNINTLINGGLVNIAAGNDSAIFAINNSATDAAIQAINLNVIGGSAIYGYGSEYGVWGSSTSGYGVLADASITGDGALYARGGDTRYGAVGRGLYGVVGLDNTEDMNNPVFNGPAGTLAGLFEGSVEIVPSAGGNADLTVDVDTFVVNSSTNRVGIGTNNPVVKLDVRGVNDQSVIYARAGTNTMWKDYDSPSETVSGIYGEGGTVTYSGVDTGWNFGVFGNAGDPGVGRSVGIMGSDFNGGGDTYAGWFEGEVNIDGQATVVGNLNGSSDINIAGNMIGYGDLNLSGVDSDINLTGTASNINLTGSITADGNITYQGKLIMTGGLPTMNATGGSCNVAPANYAEGTMFICHWCATQWIHAVMARMNGGWVNIGYAKGALCQPGDTYIPEHFNP